MARTHFYRDVKGLGNVADVAVSRHAQVQMEAAAIAQEAFEGAEGMIVTQGGRFGGDGFYVLKGKPVFLFNLLDFKRVHWEAPDALTPGKHTLEFDFKYDGLGFATLAFNNVSGIGRGGTGVLKVDGKEVARQTMEHTIPLTMPWDENFDIGADTGTPVSEEYQVPFKFTGKLNKLTLKIERPTWSQSAIAEGKFLLHLIVGLTRNANAAAVSNSFEAGGNIDAIAVEIISFDDDVAEMHTNAERHLPLALRAGVARSHGALNLSRTADAFDDAGELDEQAVPNQLHGTAAVLCDRWVNDFGAVFPQ
jgi:hypothetical protein